MLDLAAIEVRHAQRHVIVHGARYSGVITSSSRSSACRSRSAGQILHHEAEEGRVGGDDAEDLTVRGCRRRIMIPSSVLNDESIFVRLTAGTPTMLIFFRQDRSPPR